MGKKKKKNEVYPAYFKTRLKLDFKFLNSLFRALYLVTPCLKPLIGHQEERL